VKSTFKKIITGLLLTVFISISDLNAQSNTNLEVFYSITDSLVQQIVSEIPGKNKDIVLMLYPGENYSVFNSTIKSAFIKAGKKFTEVPPDELNIPVVEIVIENASVNYGEVYKDGLFGSHYTPRNISVQGNYLQSFSEKGKQEFEISFSDTVKVDEISKLENESFPFTKGVVPSEPFISGLVEPVLAVGAAAAMVVLFFSIRSK